MYIFITSQFIDVLPGLSKYSWNRHQIKNAASDKTEGKRSTADNIRRSTKTHVALSSKILERCAENYLYKQYMFVRPMIEVIYF